MVAQVKITYYLAWMMKVRSGLSTVQARVKPWPDHAQTGRWNQGQIVQPAWMAKNKILSSKARICLKWQIQAVQAWPSKYLLLALLGPVLAQTNTHLWLWVHPCTSWFVLVSAMPIYKFKKWASKALNLRYQTVFCQITFLMQQKAIFQSLASPIFVIFLLHFSAL